MLTSYLHVPAHEPARAKFPVFDAHNHLWGAWSRAAVLEGVAMEMRLNLEILAEAGCAVRELRLVGGGARSSRWNQLRADVLGRELQVTDTVEAGCAGAALLARTAATRESGLILAKRWARVMGIYRPDPERWEFYQDKFTRYRDVYPALAQLRI